MKRLFPMACTAVIALSFQHAAASSPATDSTASPPLSTVAERSGFLRTGRYDEVIALCDAFARHYPDAVRCRTFGTTPEGRPMKLLVVTGTGAFTPELARAGQWPVVLVQGGIHAGEIDGKDAGFLALRQMLDGELAKGDLDRQVLLFVPVFNVDGHENFRAWNRPNQRGPEQMGWRTTAQNFNLNRDYVKADTPEMQAMLALVDAWDPLATIDLHVTDGAKFQHGVSVEIEPLHAGDTALREIGAGFRDGVVRQLDAQGAMAVPFYPSLVEYDNPDSGFADSVYAPRFSNGYFQLRNRFGMLVETHSWKPYPTRVRITHDAIIAVLDQVAAHGGDWLRVAHAADQRATHLAGSALPLDWKTTDRFRMIDFQGYAWTRTHSDISGALMTHYDESMPQVWHVPLRDEVVPDHLASVPRGGYLVPAAHAAWVGAKLRQHGIAFRRIGHELRAAAVRAWRASDVDLGAAVFRRPPACRRDRSVGIRTTGPCRRRIVRACQPAQGATGHGPARTAGPGFAAGLGRVQQCLRAEGIHGALRGGDGCPPDAGRRPRIAGRVPAQARQRPCLRQGPAGPAGLLLPPPPLLRRPL